MLTQPTPRLTLLALTLAAACTKTDKAPEAALVEAVAPATVHVTATDYAFQAPDTLPAGLTSFHLMNNGQELHHVTLVRLAEGQTIADLSKLESPDGMPAGMALVGGPNPAPPGGSAEAVVDLKPGHYGMICVIPSSTDGKPHMMKGMVRELTVTPSQTTVQAPTADVTIRLSDYAFDMAPALTAGHHVIRVENAGPQPHEFVFVKLEAGKTAEDFVKWAEKMQGPPPGAVAPGVSVLTLGEANFVTVDLTAGEYALVCFVSDSKDHKPHFMHGMVKQITVL